MVNQAGVLSQEAQKGLYIDGHECLDVIDAQGSFLAKMQEFQQYVPFPHIAAPALT